MANINFKDTVTINGTAPASSWTDADGKGTITATLDNGTGDEAALVINGTVNKATSGEASGITQNWTDTLSPARIAALDVYRGGDRECLINTGADNYPSMYVKWYTKMSGGWACFTAATQADSGKYCTMFANGAASSGALAAGDVGIFSQGNSNKGFKFMDDQVGGYTYAPIVTYAVRLGEKGGSDLVDVGIMRYGAGVARIFNGDLNSISTSKLMVTDLVAPDGSPDALTIANDGGLTANVSLTIAASAKVVLDTNVLEYADTVALTDESAVDLFDLTIASNEQVAGVIHYATFVKDGSSPPEQQVHCGTVHFAAVNKDGTITTDIAELTSGAGGEVDILTSGTLTDAWTAVDGTGKVTVRANFNTSLTPTTFELAYHLHLFRPRTLTKK